MIVLVMIDGLRPDAIEIANCPHIKGFRSRSAATMQARSVMPSITLPCHTTIFHSVLPSRHGITTNTWKPFSEPLPGLFEVANAANKRCAFFYNWEELRDIGRPSSLTYSFYTRTAYQPDGDQIIAVEAARQLVTNQFDFAFVYFGTVDSAGHHYGWMSEGYINQVAAVDSALGTLLTSLPANSTVLIQSDHGGHDHGHGTESDEDMTIFWMVSGPNIRAGHTITTPVSLLDTAPTLARLLNINAPSEWEGQCIEEIFA